MSVLEAVEAGTQETGGSRGKALDGQGKIQRLLPALNSKGSYLWPWDVGLGTLTLLNMGVIQQD